MYLGVVIIVSYLGARKVHHRIEGASLIRSGSVTRAWRARDFPNESRATASRMMKSI
jgi:hypothetical protein